MRTGGTTSCAGARAWPETGPATGTGPPSVLGESAEAAGIRPPRRSREAATMADWPSFLPGSRPPQGHSTRGLSGISITGSRGQLTAIATDEARAGPACCRASVVSHPGKHKLGAGGVGRGRGRSAAECCPGLACHAPPPDLHSSVVAGRPCTHVLRTATAAEEAAQAGHCTLRVGAGPSLSAYQRWWQPRGPPWPPLTPDGGPASMGCRTGQWGAAWRRWTARGRAPSWRARQATQTRLEPARMTAAAGPATRGRGEGRQC